MNIVTCPLCGTQVRVSHEMADEEMHCPHCGQAFHGTTPPDEAPPAEPRYPVAPPVAPPNLGPQSGPFAPARPGAPAGPGHPGGATGGPGGPAGRGRMPIRRTSPVGLIVVGVGVVAVIVMFIVIGYLAGNPMLEIRDENGKVLYKQRVPKESYEEIKAQKMQEFFGPPQYEKPADERKVRLFSRPPSPAPTSPDTTTPDASTPDVPSPEATSPEATSPEATSPDAATPASDPRLAVVNYSLLTDPAGDRFSVVGSVRNRYDVPLRSAVVQVILHRTGNISSIRLNPVTVEYLPAGGAVRFSVPFSGVREDQIERTEFVITDAKKVPRLVVLACENASVMLAPDGKQLVVSGEVPNTAKTRIVQTKIVCDFFTSEGEYADRYTTEGIENDGNAVAPGKTAYFLFRCQPESLFWKQLRNVDVRLVAEAER